MLMVQQGYERSFIAATIQRILPRMTVPECPLLVWMAMVGYKILIICFINFLSILARLPTPGQSKNSKRILIDFNFF